MRSSRSKQDQEEGAEITDSVLLCTHKTLIWFLFPGKWKSKGGAQI